MGRKKQKESAILQVKAGLEALEEAHRNKINVTGLNAIESADIDKSFKKSEPNSHRWDYYILFQKHEEMYLEVHEVSEDELERLFKKAEWLRNKIASLDWPETPSRPLFVAPTRGITPGAVYGSLSLRMAERGLSIVRKGDSVRDLLK